MTDEPVSASGGGSGTNSDDDTVNASVNGGDGAHGSGDGAVTATATSGALGTAPPATEPAASAPPIASAQASATTATATIPLASAAPETETSAAARPPASLLAEAMLVLAPDEARALRTRLEREGIGENDSRIVRYLPDLVRRSKRTVLSEIVEALGPDRGARIRETVERLGLDENDPRLVGYALNQDLEAVLERLPDETAAAAATFAKSLDTATGRIETAFETGIERVENAAASYGAKELVTFDVAFAKVASDRVERVVAAVVKAVQSPWNRWATVAIVIVGLALAFTAGWWDGRAQIADRFRVYEARYAPMTPAIRRFVDGFWR